MGKGGDPDAHFGFVIYPVSIALTAVPTISNFVKVSEDKLAGLGTHDSIQGGKNLIVTDFEGFRNGSSNVHNDIYLDSGQ